MCPTTTAPARPSTGTSKARGSGRRRALWRARIALAAVVLAAASMAPNVAHAHAGLIDSDPAFGEVLDASPGRIVLRFTEDVDLVEDAVRLLASDGSPSELSDIGQAEGDESMTATIPTDLADGSYVIAWSALSADSHPISGAIPFSVGEPSGDAVALAAELTEDDEPIFNQLVVGYGRLVSYAAALVLIGIAGVAAMVLPELLARRQTATWLLSAAVLGALGTAAMLAGQSHRIGGSFVDWSSVVSTHAGLWWALRLIVFVAAIVVVPEVRRLDTGPARVIGAVLALSVFAVVAAGGHAISGSSQQLGLVATIVHLAAAAAWIGALLVLVVLTPAGERWEIAPRISLVALAAVAALAGSGTVNGWRQLNTPGDLVSTGYGRWLVAKLCVVAIVLGFAARSRRTVNAASRAVPSGDATGERGARGGKGEQSAALRRTVLTEIAGIGVILVLTVGLTAAVPPRATSADALTDRSPSVAASATRDDLVAVLEVQPATAGENSLTVVISSSRDERPVADEISVVAALPEAAVGPIDIAVEPDGPNRVVTDSATFPTPGRWTVTVTARYGEFDQTVFDFEVAIAGR